MITYYETVLNLYSFYSQDKPVWERIPGNFREGGWVVVSGIPKKESGGYILLLIIVVLFLAFLLFSHII